MEVVIAVVRLNRVNRDASLNDFDILLVNEPSSSKDNNVGHQLPRCRAPENSEHSEIAMNCISSLCGSRVRRALSVPLWEQNNVTKSGHRSWKFRAQYGLYCIPILHKDKEMVVLKKVGHFESLKTLVKQCNMDARVIDLETRHCILQLESWLKEQLKNAAFIASVFLRKAAIHRILACAHNPAYDPQCSTSCYKRMGRGRNDEGKGTSCDLAEEVRRSNDARARMMGYEKYDMFIINPIFGTGLVYNGSSEIKYFVKGRTERLNSMSSSSSGGESWAERYPLHKAAIDDNADEIRRLLSCGMLANQLDNATWTPLHYCAFYNYLKSAEALLLHQSTDVNVPNKAGSTPLHFAALQGNAYMVELLLSHSMIDLNARDRSGRRALDVCESSPKAEHQKVATLLRSWKRPDKIQVEMMDGGNAQLTLVNGEETTAKQLHDEMCKELNLNEESSELFAVWICSDRLSLQLKEEHKPLLHMNKWKSKIAKFGREDVEAKDDDSPRLVFRRDARIALQKEKNTKLTPMALSLLYEEARSNYINGLYPCSDSDLAALAAIILHIMHGQRAQLTEQFVESVLPIHRIPTISANLRSFKSRIDLEQKSRKRKSLIALQQDFLKLCWRFSLYGATFFDAIVFLSKPAKGSLQVHAGVNDYGLHLITASTKTLFQTYPFAGLKWSMKEDRPYIEVLAQPSGHEFTLRTLQAVHINSLLTRLKKLATQ